MLNRYIDKNEPWKLNGEKLSNVLTHSISSIQEIAYLLTPLLPETAKKISYQFSFKELKLKPPLFPRLK